MNYRFLILLAMIFMHIVDDYYLQGLLAQYKQKSWWQQNYPDEKYKYDYLMALFMHSFSWTFMMMLPATLWVIVLGGVFPVPVFICNIMIHMGVDNLKANNREINLIQDQSIHLLQILFTWMCMLIK